ncbi:MAG: glycoside hydrolase family 38 C-terminal domain-containing protein [Phycisphaerales bacterium]
MSDQLAQLRSLIDARLSPRTWSLVAPLRCEFAPHAAASDIEARALTYRPVEIGLRWGPVWSIAWFRLTAAIPVACEPLHLRFSSGTEATLWQNGAPIHGLDVNHTLIPLDISDGDIELYIEAACNRPLGATTFFWDDAAEHARWKEEIPGRLEFAEVVRVIRAWRSLDIAARFAVGLLSLADLDARRRGALDTELRSVLDGAETDASEDFARRADARLRLAITGDSPLSGRTECFPVGHAHIDTAWLWRLDQTRRKCLRTFATALRMLDDHPRYLFLCSQAQQYAWVECDSPTLFARIARHVSSGRWEPGGAMWIEPDANLPSGESLIRQLVHGTRYWRECFGDQGAQRYLYLPDTFGFPGTLPQLIAQSGLDTFIANKLAWNDTNEFPHSTFLWQGLDGTRVLSHMTPGLEYNATNTPPELRKGRVNHERKDAGRAPIWLQPFGFGDGGGGPTEWMLDNLVLADTCPEMPATRVATPRDFVRELHAAARSTELPVHAGELYLERHRGTYTTQAWIKNANRRAERALRRAEWLACAAPGSSLLPREVRGALDEAWKLLLLNQFHDILPGSSIGEVYGDAREQFETITATAAAITAQGIQAWCGAESRAAPAPSPSRSTSDARSTRTPAAQSHVVFNPCSSPRSEVIDIDGTPRFVADVPAMGCRVVAGTASKATSLPPVTLDGLTLANSLISCTLDATGAITGLVHLPSGAQLAEAAAPRGPSRAAPHAGSSNSPPDPARGVLGRLVTYRDEPKYWEAWDIDEDYLNHATALDSPADSWRVVELNPLRASVEFVRRFGKGSTITQRYQLRAGSPRVDVRCHVDWREERTLLRVLFATSVRGNQATYDASLGFVTRGTGRETPHDRARFEVPAHRWMDLSAPGAGLAILNDCKYGHSCHGHVMGLSLLRSARFPDPRADIGEHEFTYSLMPHDGDWRRACVDIEAEALNDSMFAASGSAPDSPGVLAPTASSSWSPFTLEHDPRSRVEILAFKPGEDDDSLVLRLVETRGVGTPIRIRWTLPATQVEEIDLLERTGTLSAPQRRGVSHRDRVTSLQLGAFQIVSLRVRR